MALQKGVHMGERIRLNTYDFKDGQWIRLENFCEFQIGEMIGEGTFCRTYRARKGNVIGKTVALKEIKRADGMTTEEYERTAQDYLADIWNYKKAMEAAQREVLSVNAIYVEKDENIFIEQDYLDGVLYSKFRFEQFDLEKELVLFKKLLHFLKALHQQNLFVLDLKQENFMVITGNNEPELVYFDLYLYNGEEKGGGEKCYPEGKRSYVEKYLRKNEFQRVDLILSILVLYERLNQTEELPKSKANIKIPDERNRVQKKIREIFIKGWDGEYECCDDLEKDIDDLEELLKEAPVPELLTERDRFVPRENACKEIEKILKCSDGRRHICVITGEGGSGKSELAREYSRYAKNNSDVTYTDIYWLTCPEGADAAVDELMETVGIGKEDAVSLTVSKLLIFDNCNFNKFSFNRDLYEKTGAAHVIVTSRVQSLNGVSGDTLYLEKYQTEEFAMRVFRKNCESSLIGNSVQIPEEYQKMIKKLIRQISCNTLLAAMQGIALRDYLHLGEAEFGAHLQMISNGIHKCLKDEPEIHLNRNLYGDEVVQDIADGDENIGSILQIIFSDQLLGRYSETEYKILTLLKVCPNRFINKDFILKLAVDSDQPTIKKQRIINRLVNDNWIKYGEINGEKEITMHPIIALAIKDRAFIDQKIEGFYNELLTKIVSLKINEPEYAEKNREYILILLRAFQEKMNDKVALVVTAYEYGDIVLADNIIRSELAHKYRVLTDISGSLNNPITFMKGFGLENKNILYIFVFDGKKVIDVTTLHILNTRNMKGKIVWCWDNFKKYGSKEYMFTFYSPIYYMEGTVFDIIPIKEIEKKCFSGNKHIQIYFFGKTKYGEIEKIGEDAFLKSKAKYVTFVSKSISKISFREFYDCKELKSVAFAKTKLMMELEAGCFAGCSELTQVLFNNKAIEILVAGSAFANCFNLIQISNNNLKVMYIGNFAFFNCTSLYSNIEILSEKVAESSFENCKGISEIKLNAQVKYIEKNAFKNCEKLTHIYFPNNIEKIDAGAFEGCSLKNIKLSGNIKTIYSSAFAGMKNVIEEFSITDTKKIVDFKWNSAKEIAVSQKLNLENVHIYNNLFQTYSSTQVNLGRNVEYDLPFENMAELFKIADEYIDNIKSHKQEFAIETKYLIYCKRFIKIIVTMCWFALVYFYYPYSFIPYAERKYFEIGVFSITSIIVLFFIYRKTCKFLDYYRKNYIIEKKVPLKIQEIQPFIYENTSFIGIEGLNILQIANHGLSNCKQLKKIYFPKLERIGESGLEGCERLEKIKFPELISVEENGFRCCFSLQEADLPKVEKIGKNAFSECESLNKMKVGTHLEEIGEKAFYNCGKLSQFYFPSSLKKISEAAFELTSLEKIELPSELKIVEKYAFAFTRLYNVRLNKNTYIEEGAFKGCKNLNIVNWKMIDHISEEAFWGCNFEKIELNVNITKIYGKAFKYNKNLKNVLLCGKNIYVENEAFYNCSSLKFISMKQIKSIGERVFTYTSVEKAYFSNISYIGNYAFSFAEDLQSVFIKCKEKRFFAGENIFENCLALNEIWIDHDGEDEIAESAFPDGIPIYVVQGSSIEKNLTGKGYTICPVSVDEMSRKHLTLDLLDQYETAKQKKEFNY